MGKIIQNGVIYTGTGSGGDGINDLADVNITSAADGQLLTYDSANSVWKNKAPSNRPVAYISFSGTAGPASWSTTPTVYNNATITGAHGILISPTDIPNYEVIFRFVVNDISTYQIPCSNITVTGDTNITVRGDYATLDSTYAVERIYHIVWSSSDTTEVVCYRNALNSKTAASGGTTLSLVTTGEKYIWDNKQAVIPQGSATNLNANNLYGEGEIKIYRSVGGTITNIPGVDGTLMCISNGSGYSTVQIFVNFNGETYMRVNWGLVLFLGKVGNP